MICGKRHKYSSEVAILDGEAFPSKLEKSVYGIHKMLERGKAISNLRRYESVRLKEKCPECGDGPVIWKVDMAYENSLGERVCVEAKGAETSDYKKRKRLWKKNPPCRLEIWKGSWRNPQMVEIIE